MEAGINRWHIIPSYSEMKYRQVYKLTRNLWYIWNSRITKNPVMWQLFSMSDFHVTIIWRVRVTALPKFAAMNLKKLASWKWKRSRIPGRTDCRRSTICGSQSVQLVKNVEDFRADDFGIQTHSRRAILPRVPHLSSKSPVCAVVFCCVSCPVPTSRCQWFYRTQRSGHTEIPW